MNRSYLNIRDTRAKRRLIQSFALYLAIWVMLCYGAAAYSQQPAALSDLLARVESHPELAMKRAEVEAAEARIPMRSSLMEPKLILGVQNVPTSFSFREDPMTAKVIGIEQMLPYPGKLGKERAIGEYSIDIARTSLSETRNILRRDIKLAWYDIVHRERSIDVNLRHVKLLDDFKKEVAVGIAYGKATISQLDQLELEQTEIEQMIAMDSSMTAMQRAKIEYITGVRLAAVPADTLRLSPIRFTLEGLLEKARTYNPKLASLRAEILQSVASIERAKLERYPDFDLMLMYMQRDDLAAVGGGHGAPSTTQMDMFSAQVAINLPFLDYGGTRNAMIAEMEAMRNMKLAEQEMMEREIRMMLTEKLAKLEELRRRHQLFMSSVFPSLETRIRSYVTQYQFDKLSLQSTISEIIDYLHKQHDVFEIESEYQKTLAEIEYIVGTEI